MVKIQHQPLDRISHLPEIAYENILTRLPLRDAVRTSILSKEWRYKWVSIPNIVLGQELWEQYIKYKTPVTLKVISILIQVLLVHNGTIREFQMTAPYFLESCPEMDQSILFLSRKRVEKFVFHMQKGDYYKLPSSFFSFVELTHLDLQACVFKPPSTFEGFGRLTRLEFNDVNIPGEILESFISNCPLLESFTLISATRSDYFKINAPKLKYLRLSYTLNKNSGGRFSKSLLTGFFNFHPVIEHLDINYDIIKFLASGGIPDKLSNYLNRLKVIKLNGLCFGELDALSFTLCLIRSSPILQSIDVKMIGINGLECSLLRYLKHKDFSGISLNQLQEIEIFQVGATLPEEMFISLLLAKSPKLKTITITPSPKMPMHVEKKLMKNMLLFNRASPKAKIIYDDQACDRWIN